MRAWLILVTLTACAAPAAGPGAVSTPSAGGGAELAAWRTLNQARQRGGCPALEWSVAAARVAEAHSADMARRGYFSHVSPEGGDPGGRLRGAGIVWNAVAENIAHTSGGPDDAARLWLGSDAHRRNLMNCSYTHTGIGEVAGRWPQIFFRPAP